MTQFFCISGKARHGKDTVAQMMKEKLESLGKKVLIAHYADLLKYICRTFFGWNGEKDEAGRTLLQKVGTEAVRAHNPDYWVNFITGIVSLFPDEWDYMIVPDCRFPNEVSKIVEDGYNATLFRVVRPDFESDLSEEQRQHASEVAMDGVQPDYWLFNTDLDSLRRYIGELCDVLVSNNPNPQYKQLSFFDEEETR